MVICRASLINSLFRQAFSIKKYLHFILIFCAFAAPAAAKEVPFTLDDRDRIIQVTEGLKSVQKQLDDQRSLSLVLLSGMFVLIGFVLWDRRTALALAIRRQDDLDRKMINLEEREARVERMLKELAEKDEKIAEALRHAHI